MEIFSKYLYVHKDFKGSTSIKYVLPVLAPEVSYSDLNVQDGGMAVTGWKRMMFETEDQEAKDKMARDLLAYCELDTLAMVKIWEKLNKI